MSRKVFIKTYGCQMNVYDSTRMEDVLGPMGFSRADTPDQADLVILNTCHIREKAEDKLFSDLGRLRPFKQARDAEGSGMIIAVAGCVAQAEGAEIIRRMPYVDIVLGPQTYHRLPEMIERAQAARQSGRGRGIIDTEFPVEPKFDHLPQTGSQGVSAFLAIQEGCDKFCTFCVVPYTRGAEYSRPAAAILAEAAHLVRNGAREITLLGQNVNAFHGEAPNGGDVWGLGRLAHALAEIEGLERIRYTTSHPRDVDDALLEAHRHLPQLMPFLHLPVQSGSDRILAKMNRRHDRADYLRLIDRFRDARPDIAFSTDLIVGFPGETDDDFLLTMDLVETIGFAQAFSFRYSPRPGTPAASMEDQIPEEIGLARLHALQALLERQQRAFNASMIGRDLPVLFEREGRHPGQLVGRSPFLQGVHATASRETIGRIVPVEIVDASLNSLAGRLTAPVGRAVA